MLKWHFILKLIHTYQKLKQTIWYIDYIKVRLEDHLFFFADFDAKNHRLTFIKNKKVRPGRKLWMKVYYIKPYLLARVLPAKKKSSLKFGVHLEVPVPVH